MTQHCIAALSGGRMCLDVDCEDEGFIEAEM